MGTDGEKSGEQQRTRKGVIKKGGEKGDSWLSGLTRRELLQESGGRMVKLALAGLLLWLHVRSSEAKTSVTLRPPGALPEKEFLGACLRCGLCVRACPYNTLELADVGNGVATGTPFFRARNIPCEMCQDIPCVKACPSGALNPSLQDITKARMGLAVLADQENCLAFLGMRCEVCFQVCPVMQKAIRLEMRPNTRSGSHALFLPVVDSAHCTGCGKCEKGCVLTEAAIRVFPRELVKGELGSHYRLGWKEKEKAGAPLVPELMHFPVRRPGE
ncbi:ferredoxin-type protein NapG [Candidatus Magnetaquicoccus inordinatus]|uniref:ferredoxin-type protein NapG n=1 Tax=Candidatus Magnetaquicoccus inordinatus TaxID=2496818 RepID=UPI00102BF66E|nr:ferredoxin-type protein NapG [Candidatus Magnetaquicoccus inordinatus]